LRVGQPIDRKFAYQSPSHRGRCKARRFSASGQHGRLMICTIFSAAGNVHAEVPFLGVTLPGSDLDWKFETIPQLGLNGRTVPLARGQALGGSSVISAYFLPLSSLLGYSHFVRFTDMEPWLE
jgi:choline dehydrogenase-like flavoprotein